MTHKARKLVLLAYEKENKNVWRVFLVQVMLNLKLIFFSVNEQKLLRFAPKNAIFGAFWTNFPQKRAALSKARLQFFKIQVFWKKKLSFLALKLNER